MTRTREEKLRPAVQLAHDLADFRIMLLSYQRPHTRVAEWLERAVARINHEVGKDLWPPIWWRYGRIDADASWLAHSFHRVDSEGFFYGETESGYVPQRDEILATMDSIYKRYKAARS